MHLPRFLIRNLGISKYIQKISILVGEKVKFFSFEPLFSSFSLLIYMENIKKLSNVTLIYTAASNYNRFSALISPPLKIILFDKNTQTKLIDKDSYIKVLVLKIDDIKFPKRIDFIKIDKDGTKFKVLKGMSNLIKNDSPVILIEENDSAVDSYLNNFSYRKVKFNNPRNTLNLK